jgi:hypothetical protein
LTFALRGLDLVNGQPAIALRVERFAETAIFNWSLKQQVLQGKGRPVSFREKWVLPRLDRAQHLVKEFPFLSWRCETTVLATVRRGREANSPRQIIVRVRSDRVGTEARAVGLFASGGCRPSESKGYEIGQYAEDSAAELAKAARKELERETGYDVRDWQREMTLIALYLDPLSPVPYEKRHQAGSCGGLLTPLVSSSTLKIVSNARRKVPLMSSLSGPRLNS